MVTKVIEVQSAVQEEARPRLLADYEVCRVPAKWRREPLKRPRGTAMPKARPLIVPVPAFVWEKIWEAIPVFGLPAIWVCAPGKAFRVKEVDPLIVGKVGFKWYFIAAWNLDNDLKA